MPSWVRYDDPAVAEASRIEVRHASGGLVSDSVLLVIDDDQDRLDAVSAALGRRYAQDYVIATETSAPSAYRRLTDLRDAGKSVALILAAAMMTTDNAPEMLALARGLHPSANRVLKKP
jgi:hypothetical protein